MELLPARIVCLTEETTETLYLLGEERRIVGISGFTVRPKEARRDKPKVSAFIDCDYEKIMALEPDLVLGFSDLQADIAKELVRRGVNVMVFNQRSVEEILRAIALLGAMVGAAEKANALVRGYRNDLDAIARRAAALPKRPRVFFEEWHEPLISGIRWCSELVEICGGDDVCKETRGRQDAKGRIFTAEDVAARDPEVVIASWCGRKAVRAKICARPGWQNVSAVRDDQLYEVKSAFILQPGPAALSDGVQQLERIIAAAAHGEPLPKVRPGDLRRA
jgi:iron complex transport system substrate-binding protein